LSKLVNSLTWSCSRDRLFNDCRRAYYYHYYGAWGGWEASAPEENRKTYLLKNIQGVDAWVGDSVHKVIKALIESIKAGSPLGHDQARRKIKEMLVTGWRQSNEKLWQKHIKKNLNLFEHYYNKELKPDVLALKIKKAVSSIDNFYARGLFDTFSALGRESFLAVDELDSFDEGGVRVFAVPDCAIKDERYVLYDWKTGKPSDKDIFQLSFYVLYAGKKWHAAYSDVEIIPVYISDPNSVITPIKPYPIDKIKEHMTLSIAAMRGVLLKGRSDAADIDLCPRTDNLRRCAFCRFQAICR